jgi:hypothetical protein
MFGSPMQGEGLGVFSPSTKNAWRHTGKKSGMVRAIGKREVRRKMVAVAKQEGYESSRRQEKHERRTRKSGKRRTVHTPVKPPSDSEYSSASESDSAPGPRRLSLKLFLDEGTSPVKPGSPAKSKPEPPESLLIRSMFDRCVPLD